MKSAFRGQTAVRHLLVVSLSAFCLLSSDLVSPQSSSSSILQDAESAWSRRAEPGQTERAIELWAQALQQQPTRAEILIRLTFACGRANRHAATKAERRSWTDRALVYGREAVQKNPQNSHAHAAYAEALGQWADAHKNFRGLRQVKQAIQELQEALRLDPQYSYAHMLLAQFYRKAPSTISVGDKKKALEHARLAVETGPQYAINHLVLAETLLDQGQQPQAVDEFQKILALTPPRDTTPETLSDQATARERLQELGIVPANAAPASPVESSSCSDATGAACTVP